MYTAPIIKWSEFQATDPVFPGLIPDATGFAEQ
jgi:hypothetical protein